MTRSVVKYSNAQFQLQHPDSFTDVKLKSLCWDGNSIRNMPRNVPKSFCASCGCSKLRRGKGSRLVGGTRLVVFLRPNRPQLEKATNWDPLASRDPLPLAPSQRGAEGGGGGSWPEGGSWLEGGVWGPGSWYSSAYTGSRSVGIP